MHITNKKKILKKVNYLYTNQLFYLIICFTFLHIKINDLKINFVNHILN